MSNPTLVPTALRLGPGFLWGAPLGSAEPTGLTGAWPSAWVPFGYTDTGHTFNYSTTFQGVSVAEELVDPIQSETGQVISIAFSMASITAINVSAALNQGFTLPAAVSGYTELNETGLGLSQRIMIGWDANDGLERLYLRKVVNTAPIAIPRGKAPAKALIPVTFTAERPLTGQKSLVYRNSTSLVSV